MESFLLFAKWIRKLSILNAAFLIMMSGFRLAALLIYGQKSNWTTELVSAFIMGLRFDAVVVGYFLIPPCLYLVAALHLRQEKFYNLFGRIFRPYYSLVYFLVAALLAIDTQYYSYFQDHFNILVFGLIEDDTKALLVTFWKNYPVLWYFVFAAIGFWLIFKLVRKVLQNPTWVRQSEKLPFAVLPLVSLVLLVSVFFLGRGSFGLFPLGQTDTVVSRDPFINHLSSNGIYSLYRAFKLRRQQNLGWDNNLKYYGYDDPRKAFADFYQIPLEQVPESPLTLFHQRTAHNPWAEKTKPHVVVLMMESFGGHWLRYHSKDFNLLGSLEKHIHEDIFLQNFLPSASSTTGSLSSIMVSAPQRPIGNFLTESQYLQVPFRSSPARIYARNGYETHFVYGGNPGWRDMNKFARYQGFEHVEGEVDMQAKLGKFKETHDWGVYDEDAFRYVETLLKEATKPQMILVMTTTNHPPYQIPSTFKPPTQKIPPELEGRLIGDRAIVEARFRTYLYSSEKLGQFLTDLKASPLAEKTLVAATGDHSFLLINFKDEELLQKWSVPFYLYAPKSLKASVNSDTFGSHMDIFPTLYNLSLSDAEYDALGVNLLDPKQPHYALHSSQLIVGPAGGANLNGKNLSSYFDWQGHYEKLVPGPETEAKKAMATRYKALMSLLDYYFMAEKKAEKK
jgi:phosphoglycerol transferase MdoB-like AlkP superfamily enzyme